MSYTDEIRDEIFERLGIYVQWWYELDAMKETLDDRLDDAIEAFNISHVTAGTDKPSEADKVAYEAFSAEIHRQQSTLESLRYGVANLVSDFLGLNVKDLLASPYSSPSDVLSHLLDLMDDNDDKVEQNEVDLVVVGSDTVLEDEDNSVLEAEGLTLPTLDDPPTQLARNDCFSLVCSDDSTVGQERWTLNSGRLGQFSGQVVTGVETDWEATGISKLKVTAAPGHDEFGDTAAMGKVTAWDLAGAVRGTNIAEDGKVWVRFNALRSFDDDNDDLGQVSNWDLDDLVFGEDTDADGKVYVSVVKDPSTYQVLGGTKAVLDVSSIIIDLADDTNTDDGTLYVKVIQNVDTGGATRDFTIELYSDSARTQLEASGTAPDLTDEDLPVEIELTPETGGVDGVITLNEFNSTQDATDATILIKVPRYFVRVYRSASRAETDLYAEAVSYAPDTGSDTLDLYLPDGEGSSYDVGEVSLNYIQDNEDIVLTVNFYTIDMYKADPDDTDTTDDDIVARAGSYTNLLTEASPTEGLTFYAVNNSGLSDVTLDLSDADVSAGVVAGAVVGYAAGDTFTFATSTEDNGSFQTFLRDTFNAVFPAGTGTEVTVSDSLAGGS